ncbi:MAG: hypothetical protein FD123_829 [Bacteroidetes bacterium]|nr:MAG: hypothetical protein FD123_829 [Bacteroidota bacterium]
MATQLRPIVTLPWGDLIGAPLIAMIEAEALAAQTSRDFIASVGFVPDKDGNEDTFGKLKTVTFTYQKQDVNGKTITDRISIPLLSLIPIPLLQIKDASLEFNLAVVDTQKINRNLDFKSSSSFFRKEQTGLVGMITGSSKGSEDTKTSFDMKVKINLVQSDIPMGLQKLFMIMDNAVQGSNLVNGKSR